MGLRIPLFRVHMPPANALMPRLQRVLYSGYIAEGEQVASFEAAFGQYIGNEHVFAVQSATAGLHLSLLLAGVQPGDEVISTPVTAVATNLAIRYVGAQVVWADVDPCTGNVTTDSVRAKITSRTRAIMAVHYGGIPVDLDGLSAVANAAGVVVIEDAAHALGARYKGQPIGNHSPFVVFSFQAIKHLTTADGGMVACRESDAVVLGKRLRWFGLSRDKPQAETDGSDLPLAGFKYNMHNVTAEIGLTQLEYADQVIGRYMDNGRFFDRELSKLGGVRVCTVPNGAEPSYWLYTIHVERRDDFMRHMLDHGVEVSLVHQRNDIYDVFADSRSDLPGVDAFYKSMVHIPCGWWVSDEDREYIVDVIKQGW